MPSSLQSLLCRCSVVTAMTLAAARAAGPGPDRVIFKNGREIEGMITSGNADSITIRAAGESLRLERKLIRRIDDTATTSAYFAASGQSLPPWNAIVNDLRTNEAVQHLRLVSTDRESTGPFAGIPCVVFAIDDAIELRVYGVPENPSGLQLGLRQGKATDRLEREKLRAFFAGFLTERNQIAALYGLQMNGGQKTAGNLRLAFGTQRSDPDRVQWWLAAWNPAALRGAGPGVAARTKAVVLGFEHGFERDREGNLQPIPSRIRVALGE